MRDFDPANVSLGSFATDRNAADPRGTSALPPKADAALVVSSISVRMTAMLDGEWEEVRRTLGL